MWKRNLSEWPRVAQAYVPPFPRVLRPLEPLEQKRARLGWYARKRGILETDLLLGTWAPLHLPTLNAQELEEFDILLHENDWSLYYWFTKAQEPPAHIASLSILPSIQEHAKNKDKKILRMP